VEPEIVSIAELAAEAWAGVQEGVRIKSARFSAQVPHECEFVWADPSGLRQIFSNLFGNSLRYIPEGGSVELLARCGQADGGWIEVSVRDDGSGIPSAHLPRIFERFYRADTARSRAEGGTGLGLSIVRHLVEAHGGRVEAESELGRGTTIRFTLPAPEDADTGGQGMEDADDES
jgi:two-component system phosphate regulon sensor histidine kinase PhoR